MNDPKRTLITFLNIFSNGIPKILNMYHITNITMNTDNTLFYQTPMISKVNIVLLSREAIN